MRGRNTPAPVDFFQSGDRSLYTTPQTLVGGLQNMPIMVGRAAPAINPLASDLENPRVSEKPVEMPTLLVNPSGSANVRDENHYAVVISLAATLVNIGSVLFLYSPQGKRNFLAIRNTSATANIYLDFNKDATVNSVFKISPGGTILFDAVVPQDDLYMISDTAGATFSFNYSNISN